MQYCKPDGDLFVGDCMPFYHDGVFHLYWLLDEKHHQAREGLGGHQWAHSSTTDLVHWTHHPLALPVTEEWEGSICTGSTFFHDGVYYGFYAVRLRDRTQQLMIATSPDGIHFRKHANPLMRPPEGYSPYHFRDPFVFWDEQTQRFHMLVTAKLEPFPVPQRGGCLAHLVSDNLWDWRMQEPFVVPGLPDAPECPDLFAWHGWYYLVFSNELQARYLRSRSPLGPWERPQQDMLDGPWTRVPKTAAFPPNRRLSIGWLGTREQNQDSGRFQWGGNLVLRELVQHADGTLGSKFLAEASPAVAAPIAVDLEVIYGDVTVGRSSVRLAAQAGLALALIRAVPRNLRIRLRGRVEAGAPEIGLQLREANIYARGYSLLLSMPQQKLAIGDAVLTPLPGLDTAFTLEIFAKDDILDVCLDERHCLINRCPEQQGTQLAFFCQNGTVTLDDIEICPLAE